jgi:type VI secretion system secreted protein VgrG
MGALADGAVALAAKASPELAKAMQVASQAQALMGQSSTALGGSGGAHVPLLVGVSALPVPIVPLVIAEHPLAGQAVNDFASKAPDFIFRRYPAAALLLALAGQ